MSCQSTGASVVKRVSDHLAALCSQGTRAGGQPVGAEVRKKGKRNTYAPSNPVKTVTVVGIGTVPLPSQKLAPLSCVVCCFRISVRSVALYSYS